MRQRILFAEKTKEVTFSGRFFSAVTIIGAVMMTIGLVFMIGDAYQSIRLATNYKLAQTIITECECQMSATVGREGLVLRSSYFYLQPENVTGKIEMRTGAELIPKGERLIPGNCAQDGFSKNYRPTKNWCSLLGDTVSVYYYGKSEKVVLNQGGVIKSVLMSASGLSFFLLLVYGIFIAAPALAIISLAGRLFQSGINEITGESIKLWRDPKTSFLERINGSALPVLILIMSSSFIILAGAALLQSLIHFDVPNRFISGIYSIVGFVGIILGPAVILQLFKYLHSDKNEWFNLFRNLIAVGVLLRLVTNAFAFTFLSDNAHPPVSGVLQYMFEFLKAPLT